MSSVKQGFPRKFRLGKPTDFQFVFSAAQKSSDAFLTVLASPGQTGRARLGLAISKKNIRKAVDRNRIKRLSRESFRLNRAELGNLDIVVMARKAALSVDRKTITKSLEKHWAILVKKCDSR